MHRSVPLAVTAALAVASFVTAAEFQPGDEVKLVREESLLFREQIERQGHEGDVYQVLGYRADQKRVYLAAKDKLGREIALSTHEDAVLLIPPIPSVLLEKALIAAEDNKFEIAVRFVEAAARNQPDDEDIKQFQRLLSSAREIKVRIDVAKAHLSKTQSEADRKRNNAAVVDRPNFLTNDNTNQTRANQMRQNADNAEARSQVAANQAQKDFQSRIGDLKKIVATRKLAFNNIARGFSGKVDRKATDVLAQVGKGTGTVDSPDQLSKVFESMGFKEVTYVGLEVPEKMRYPLVAVGTVQASGAMQALERSALLGRFQSDIVEFNSELEPIKGVWMGRKTFIRDNAAHMLIVTPNFLFMVADLPQGAPARFFLIVAKLPSGDREGFVLR